MIAGLEAHIHGVAHSAAHGMANAGTLLALGVVAAVVVAYLILALRQRRDQRSWTVWRIASFLTGSLLLLAALVPQLSPFPAGDFREHMHQHLLIGMYAPLGLVLGAPVTLLLRSLPRRRGQLVGRVLRSRPAHVLAHPVTALALNLGGLALLYFTPLYGVTAANPALHHLAHLHFLAAGCLFAWVIAGPDPAPRRPSVPARLVVLGVAIAGHAVLSQLLYAGAFVVDVPVPPDQRRGGAELMYYGGDIAELLLALALVTTWRPQRRQRHVLPLPTPWARGISSFLHGVGSAAGR
jgi:putative membrane protein